MITIVIGELGTVTLKRSQEELEIRGRIETLQSTSF